MRLATITRQALTGVAGGTKFLAALAAGDMAPDEAVEARRAACRACPSRVRVSLLGCKESDWCGPPLAPAADPPTCGCLIAGKTAVASEACPQGKWGAV